MNGSIILALAIALGLTQPPDVSNRLSGDVPDREFDEVSLGAGQPFEIQWHTIDGGGGTSAGAGFELAGTIGQPDAGSMSGGGYELAGGFWAGAGAGPQPKCAFADLNCDGVVDVSDLLLLLAAWGPCPEGESCAADFSGDGTVDVSDLLMLLSSWG